MSAWMTQNAPLLLCLLGSVAVTVLPKVLPVVLLRGQPAPAAAALAFLCACGGHGRPGGSGRIFL